MAYPIRSESRSQDIVFTLEGALQGAKRSLPLTISVLVYGTAFGMLARQTGLSLSQSFLMSGLVHAGAAQLVALGLWTMPLPMLAIIFTTFLVNLRHVLYGAALRPWFGSLSSAQQYFSAFFMADESWALAMQEFAAGNRNGAVMAGCGGALMAGWVGGTLIGYQFGAVVQDPAVWGLDFAFTAVFVAMLVGIWKGRKRHLLPWVTAAVVAVVTSYFLPGAWHILSGGLAGSIVGGLIHDA